MNMMVNLSNVLQSLYGKSANDAILIVNDKGKRGGTCKITICNNSDAVFKHKDTGDYYCSSCAKKINEEDLAVGPLCAYDNGGEY